MSPWISYTVGRCLFLSGIAQWHRRIHEFAMRRLQIAADQNHGPSQLFFGQLLKYRGASVLNRVAGIRYLHDSAEKGSADAQFMLAEALLDPELMYPSDLIKHEPVSLYERAAEAGHKMAALRLSKAYGQGALGLQQNTELAARYFDQFSRDGNLPND